MKKGLYKHYKGGIVRVLDTVHHSETLEDMVLYMALYECRDFGIGSLWVRPQKMFLEEIEINGQRVPRFEYLEKEL